LSSNTLISAAAAHPSFAVSCAETGNDLVRLRQWCNLMPLKHVPDIKLEVSGCQLLFMLHCTTPYRPTHYSMLMAGLQCLPASNLSLSFSLLPIPTHCPSAAPFQAARVGACLLANRLPSALQPRLVLLHLHDAVSSAAAAI
jgi:hypothetical protein